MADTNQKQDGENKLFKLSARIDVPLEQTKDIQDAMVAGAADKSKIEANRTNRHSGSAGGDQMMSIELIFDDGRTVSRNQPGHENDKSEKVAAPRSTALEFLSEHELSKDDFDRRLNSVGKARDMLLCAAVDIGAEPHKLAALNIGRDDVGSALGVYLLGPELAQTIGAKGTKTFGDQLILFGIAPLLGACESGADQWQNERAKLAHRGASNVLIGSAIGYALERAHPAIGAGALALGVGALGNDLVLSPEAQKRNSQLKTLADSADGLTAADLVRFSNHTKQTLGPAVFQGAFDLAIGGVGIPGAKQTAQHAAEQTVSSSVRDEALSATNQAAERSFLGRPFNEVVHESMSKLGELSKETWYSVCAVFSNNRQRPAYATSGDAPIETLSGKVAKNPFEEFLLFMEPYREKPMSKHEANQFNDYWSRESRFERAKIGAHVSDMVVQQLHPDGCVAAVGQMVCREGRSQQEFLLRLAEYASEPSKGKNDPSSLAWLLRELGPNYEAVALFQAPKSELESFFRQQYLWVAEIRVIGKNAHEVIVEKIDSDGLLVIRDPLEKKEYKMQVLDFLEYWTRRGIAYRGKEDPFRHD
ncbi:MAG: hypothetical protein KA392_02280 [Candidatus Obscuribacter sp.]|nr:hypothetical protein [Candidatus Obscuribacter sp.]